MYDYNTLDKNKKCCINCSLLRNGYCVFLQRKMTSDINSLSKTIWLTHVSCDEFKNKNT